MNINDMWTPPVHISLIFVRNIVTSHSLTQL